MNINIKIGDVATCRVKTPKLTFGKSYEVLALKCYNVVMIRDDDGWLNNFDLNYFDWSIVIRNRTIAKILKDA